MTEINSLKRRTFLKLSVVTGTSVLFAGCSALDFVPDIPSRPDSSPDDAMLWISWHNGQYRLHMPRIEMGQNIATTLKQVACEELAIDWHELQVEMQSTLRINPVKSTVGSESVMLFAIALAQACAALRDAVESGNTHGQVDVVERPLAELRCFGSDTRFVGKSPEPVQTLEIVTGQPVYVSDVRLPGMRFGTVIYPDYLPELPAKLLHYDLKKAQAIPGFVAVLEHELLRSGQQSGLGIVAETPQALSAIRAALNPQWQEPEKQFSDATLQQLLDIDNAIARGDLSNTVREQNWDSPGDEEFNVDIRLDIPSAAHAPIEPRAAVADFSTLDSAEIWVGNQDAFFIKDKLTRRLSLPDDSLTVHACRIGGAFGGKTICTVELEAAVLSAHCRQPVKVQWTREQEYCRGFHRPPSSHRIKARVKQGKITHWFHGFTSSHILFTNAVAPAWMQGITNLVVGDPGVARGADLHYEAEAQKIQYGLHRLPYFTGPWRGLGAGPNYLAIESAIDQCAFAARMDPYEFRARNLSNVRFLGVLHRVAESADWLQLTCASKNNSSNTSDDIRYGQGIACGIYKNKSYGATVARVSVDKSGQVLVKQIFCSHDCGKIINPDQVKAQCEGNVLWGISFVLCDKMHFKGSAMNTRQFTDSPIPRCSQTPEINVELIKSDELPTGAGETLMVSVMGAICNAIFDATGHRVARLPVVPATLKQV